MKDEEEAVRGSDETMLTGRNFHERLEREKGTTMLMDIDGI